MKLAATILLVIGLAIQAFANPHPVTVNTSLLLPPGASRDGTMSANAPCVFEQLFHNATGL